MSEESGTHIAWQTGDYTYTWQGNGMLRSVTRPDGKTVTFKYDALGRRIEKVFDGRVYRYLWDGDVILHEWDYAEADRPNTIVTETGEVTLDRPEPIENLITWVYDSDSYVPTAKIVGDKHYSIISDYIGRPAQAYDDNGNIVWQADYDIYGNLRNLHGSRQFIPFRQLGQYEDEETGLYYNRFRYYDPRIGNYISQDPIRLAGNNPTLYGYVEDCNQEIDIWGLDCSKIKTKKDPVHHIATNKHSIWSDRFRELFKKNGLGRFKNGNWRKDILNDPLNKVTVPGHKGPHPEAMHQEIYKRLSEASELGSEVFKQTLEELSKEATEVGSWLNKILTKT